MKKILVLALAVISILCLAACGASEPEAAPPEVAVSNVIAPAVAPAEVVAAPVEESITTGISAEPLLSGEMPSAEPAA